MNQPARIEGKPVRIVREMNGDGRAKDHKPILGGDLFRTLSGRTTTPFPRQRGERFASQWLKENAIAEAEAVGDNYNATLFNGITIPKKGGELTTTDRESALLYLFEHQPKPAPSMLKNMAP